MKTKKQILKKACDGKGGVKNVVNSALSTAKEYYKNNMAKYRKDSGINKNMFPDSLAAGAKAVVGGALGLGKGIKNELTPKKNILKKVLKVNSYRDNQDGTTTNKLSDGSTSTVKYSKNSDGSLQPKEVASTPTLVPYSSKGFKKVIK